jgi:hypothetical protein
MPKSYSAEIRVQSGSDNGNDFKNLAAKHGALMGNGAG